MWASLFSCTPNSQLNCITRGLFHYRGTQSDSTAPKTLMETHWTTRYDELEISHDELLGQGGYGEVHKV